MITGEAGEGHAIPNPKPGSDVTPHNVAIPSTVKAKGVPTIIPGGEMVVTTIISFEDEEWEKEDVDHLGGSDVAVDDAFQDHDKDGSAFPPHELALEPPVLTEGVLVREEEAPILGEEGSLLGEASLQEGKSSIREEASLQEEESLIREEAPAQVEEAPIQEEALTQGEEVPIQEEAPTEGEEASIQEEAPTQEEEALIQEEAPTQEEGSPTQEEVPIQGKGASHQTAALTGGDAMIQDEEAAQGEPLTQRIVVTGIQVQVQPAKGAPLSLASRFNKRVLERTIENFQTCLRDSIQIVLDEGCSFDQFRPYLHMYLDEPRMLTGGDAASPFQRCLKAGERDVQELLALCSKDTVALAAKNGQSIMKEHEQCLDETMPEETRLLKEVERATVAGEVVVKEHWKTSTFLADATQSISNAKHTIGKLQSFLVVMESTHEQMLKYLEEIKNRQQLIIAEFEEKSQDLEAVRHKLHNTVSLTEEDIHQKVLTTLDREHKRRIRDVESRLKRF
ncbi:protein IWS1 homolog [Asparagus officinalis]|uniref:protein IWS1 homolog n=1 Tax=Asparagus officinalis TaxID=4686 RepID=UPI00098DF6B5|nr:protein IWS1 homolog [Asparagus officinalis]